MKVSILVPAWRLSKELLLCVTGTFTQHASCPGCPNGTRYGDGLKRRNRQSSFDPPSACAPDGSARTSPPAFPFLQTTLSKSKFVGQRPECAARLTPPRRESDFPPSYPRQVSYQSGDCCPLVARHVRWRSRGSKLISTAWGVNSEYENFTLFSCASSNSTAANQPILAPTKLVRGSRGGFTQGSPRQRQRAARHPSIRAHAHCSDTGRVARGRRDTGERGRNGHEAPRTAGPCSCSIRTDDNP